MNISAGTGVGCTSERLKVQRMARDIERYNDDGNGFESKRDNIDITRIINIVSKMEDCSPHEKKENPPMVKHGLSQEKERRKAMRTAQESVPQKWQAILQDEVRLGAPETQQKGTKNSALKSKQ